MQISWQAIEQKIQSDFPNVKSITADELAAWLDDESRTDPIIIDARSKGEYEVSHLKDAVHAEAAKDASKVVGDRPCVVYCSVGYRSAKLINALAKAGRSNAVNLQGSIFGWLNTDRSVYLGEEVVKQVHPYNNKWAQLLKPEYRND